MISAWLPTTRHRWRTTAISAAALLLIPLVAIAEVAEDSAAARRGVAYLIDRADEMPGPWRYNMFSFIVKVGTDPDQLKAAEALLRSARQTPFAELPARFAPNMLRVPTVFRQTLGELLRRKEAGQDWQGPTRQLAALLEAHEGDLSDLWQRLGPTQRLITLARFDRLGIRTALRETEVVADLHARWASEDRRALLVNRPFMFGITHVILVRSGYFERMLDPALHRVESDVLDQAAQRYAHHLPADPIFLDIAGEVLAARRLLGLPPSAATRKLAASLVARQRSDGSWGDKHHQRDIHATIAVVLGLGDWADPFRRAVPAR